MYLKLVNVKKKSNQFKFDVFFNNFGEFEFTKFKFKILIIKMIILKINVYFRSCFFKNA